MASIETISRWLDTMYADEDTTHMIVVCDTYDYEDYPVYVDRTQNVRNVEKKYYGNMQKVMEVYSRKLTKEAQLEQFRAFNYD